MEKNYYKILEIDKDASQEIIKKAYTTLAKKYHPDLQEGSQKSIFEEKLKLINEAYEVLSNEEKRKQYDIQLSHIEPDADSLLNENSILRDELNKYKNNPTNVYQTRNSSYSNNTNNNNTNNNHNNINNSNYQRQLEYQQELQRAREQAYHDAYVQDLKNRGYKIRYKKSFNDYVKNFISLICTILILFLLYQIPFVKNFFIDLYNTNNLFKFLIDIFKNLFLSLKDIF